MFLAHLLPPHPASFDYFRQALLSSSNPITQTGPQQQGRFLPPVPLLCLIPALVQFPLLILANWEGNAANVCKTIGSSSPEPPARVVFTWDRAVTWLPLFRLRWVSSIHLFLTPSVSPHGLHHVVPGRLDSHQKEGPN